MPVIDPAILRSIPLFALLDDAETSVLAQQLDVYSYISGQQIIQAGAPGNAMYCVQSGKVELYIHDKNSERVSLAVIGPGDLFGELSLLDTEPRSASAIALEYTTLLVIDRNDLEVLITAHPPAALDMMAMLGKRMRETNALLSNRVAKNVNEEIQQPTNIGERISDFLTMIAGDIRFVYFSVIWFGLWVILNTNIIPGVQPFDPFPFGLLTMVVSLEAIFLSLFVLISQNRQAARDKVRNDVEYEVNLKAEIEIRDILLKLENLQQLVIEHLPARHDLIVEKDSSPRR